jgi:uncharacterized protein (TIGR02145 family)
MGFIRNFEIWTNQRPRVCNFDIMDYIETGIIGNSCTENTRSLDSIDWADSQTTANATHDAWLKAVNEYFLSALAFFYQSSYQNYQGHPNPIPDQDNFRCITPENYNKIIDLIYGPDGFWEKSFDFDVARLLWWNCLLDPGSPNKRTGTYSDTFRRPTGKYSYIDKPFTVDFANYQTPSYEKYLEFRSKMDPMLASLKIIMQTAFKHPLTDYEIGPEPCPDIIIGTQIWKRCNLRVDKYRNGDPIPEVQDPIAWAALTTGAWCYYNNDPKTENVYGKMYNWYAVNDPRGLAPVGYHIPTDAEWGLLVDYVGGSDLAGGVLKQKNSVNPNFNPLYSAGYYCTSWDMPSSSSNEREFTATAAGYRLDDGDFYREHQDAFWWTQTLYDIDSAVTYNMNYTLPRVGRAPGSFGTGLSVRVLKGETPIECPDVTIGTQTWTRCNLNTAFYRNGDPIPQVTDPTEWEDLTTGAWCYYNNDPSNEAIYGKLYNWYAINDPRGIAPVGYHVPIIEECNTLIDYLGGSLVAGGKMKRAGTLGVGKWQVPNTDGTNESLFTALAGGGRNNNGLVFFGITEGAVFWTADEKDEQNGMEFNLFYDNGEVPIGFDNKHNGYSVRLVKGETPPLPVCKEITIGTQTWTGCNLDVTTYRNGDVIPQVQDPTEWANLTTGAWCYYNNAIGNNYTYGKLYNWYAVNDPRGLAPEGWHIPSDEEWTTLKDYIGGEFVAGGKLKEAGLTHWNSPNIDATNEFCFTALPGGTRYDIGSYSDIGDYGYWWSSTESSTSNAWYSILGHDSGEANRGGSIKKAGLSVRLVKDCVVTIGTQTWQCENLNVATYRNGDIIPQVTDPNEWINLTTGAWCYYNNDPANEAIYGKLYNWYAVNDPRGIGPIGYHIPSETEWNTLKNNLGGDNVAGGKMKSTGTTYWNSPNTGATNSSGFNGLPTGGRGGGGGNFSTSGLYGYWWSSTGVGTQFATICALYHNSTNAGNNALSRRNGNSIRMIKD